MAPAGGASFLLAALPCATVIVGIVAESIVGWRLPFGIIGALAASLLGIWLLTDKGSSRDLGIFGVLYYNGATYLRGIFVPDVPIVLAQKTANSLPEMLTHYLYSLGNKNAERKVN